MKYLSVIIVFTFVSLNSAHACYKKHTLENLKCEKGYQVLKPPYRYHSGLAPDEPEILIEPSKITFYRSKHRHSAMKWNLNTPPITKNLHYFGAITENKVVTGAEYTEEKYCNTDNHLVTRVKIGGETHSNVIRFTKKGYTKTGIIVIADAETSTGYSLQNVFQMCTTNKLDSKRFREEGTVYFERTGFKP